MTAAAAPGQALRRDLTARQMAMIAIGGAIGTGLFLGSGFAVSLAGPAVLGSYAVAGLVAAALMRALAEMVEHHPDAGGFGNLSERYLGLRPGFLLRWTYWSANVLAIGTEVTAVALYMRAWWPAVPGIWWIGGFSAALVAANALGVRWYGLIEYGFSAVKVTAIALFLLLGAVLLFRASAGTGFPVSHPLPHGLGGAWLAVVVAIFSFVGVESIAVAAGEAADPARAVRRAARMAVLRLLLFYLGTLFVTLSLVPWNRIGTTESPFITVMRRSGLPGAAGAMNAVLLIAALSAMNEQLYAAARMLHGLALAGSAPAGLARTSRFGVPVRALLLSTAGVAVAGVLFALSPSGAFPAMIALSTFGALFTWGLILLTHLRFRRVTGRSLPLPSLLALLIVAAVTLTTPFAPAFRLTLLWGLPFVALLALLFPLAKTRPIAAAAATGPG